MCAVYSYAVVAEKTARKWFSKLRSGKFDLENRESLGSSTLVDDDQIGTLI